MIPPTSFLPPIKRIKQTPPSTLQQCLNDLQALYNPPVRGSTRRKTHLNNSNPQKDAEPVHLDAFERSYSIQWLAALLSLSDVEEDDPRPSTGSSSTDDIVSEAAALLANISGTAGAGNVERQFVFPTSDGQTISVHIRDAPLDNQDYGSVGAQTWGGACILSEMIVEDPPRFGLPSSLEDLTRWSKAHGRRTLRILELGAGTGLVSLAIYRYLSTLGDLPHPHSNPLDSNGATEIPRVEIVATDYYPSVLDNLHHNVQRNVSKPTRPSWLSFHVAPMDWSTFGLNGPAEDILNEPFDIVFGADIVYEADHATWIHRCLKTLLRKPSNEVPSRGHAFHLVFPLRHTHSQESNMVDTVFHSLAVKERSQESVGLTSISTEDIVCDAEVGSDDEVQYAYREIAWA